MQIALELCLALFALQEGNAPAVLPAKPETVPAKPETVRVAPAKRASDIKKPAPESATPGSAIVVPAPRPRAPEIPNYRISVKLKTGRRFSGIVTRDRSFHELVHSGAHHGTTVYSRPDHFVLRFVDGLDGSVELAWRQLAKLEVREILDFASLQVMEEQYTLERVVRRAEADAAAAAAAAADGAAEGAESPPASDAQEPAPEGQEVAPVPGEAPVDGAPETTEPTAESAAEAAAKAAAALLAEFPPAEAWTPERKRQIEWRRTVVGNFPDVKEERFLAVFDQWLPHYYEWAAAEAERIKAAEKAAQKETPDKKPLGEKLGAKPAAPKTDATGTKPPVAPPRTPAPKGSG